MKVGFVGLGKLGLPVALAISSKTHTVCGYDIDPSISDYLSQKSIPYLEADIDKFFESGRIDLKPSVEEVVSCADIIFIAVQTPHEPLYEGVTRIPEARENFDYKHLQHAFKEVSKAALKIKKSIIVTIISTVLPGTLREVIFPHSNDYISICYNPFFIAMGSTIQDFLDPEFVLLGSESGDPENIMKDFYATIHSRSVYTTNIENAELIKVAYNTAISAKISFANTLMEICSKSPGLNVDEVMDGLLLSSKRLFSPAYLRGGMGDGGGCHPRDNIAMSWLAQRLNLSFDLFDALMTQRQAQTEWMASVIEKISMQHRDQGATYVCLLGLAFKPNTNIITGSPARLLSGMLDERGIVHAVYDPHVGAEVDDFKVGVYFVATKHDEFMDFNFPRGSVVLDPFRYIPQNPEITLIRLGEFSDVLLDQ